jgi:hypothetical protein
MTAEEVATVPLRSGVARLLVSTVIRLADALGLPPGQLLE